jgi:hypothetical protein
MRSLLNKETYKHFYKRLGRQVIATLLVLSLLFNPLFSSFSSFSFVPSSYAKGGSNVPYSQMDYSTPPLINFPTASISEIYEFLHSKSENSVTDVWTILSHADLIIETKTGTTRIPFIAFLDMESSKQLSSALEFIAHMGDEVKGIYLDTNSVLYGSEDFVNGLMASLFSARNMECLPVLLMLYRMIKTKLDILKAYGATDKFMETESTKWFSRLDRIYHTHGDYQQQIVSFIRLLEWSDLDTLIRQLSMAVAVTEMSALAGEINLPEGESFRDKLANVSIPGMGMNMPPVLMLAKTNNRFEYTFHYKRVLAKLRRGEIVGKIEQTKIETDLKIWQGVFEVRSILENTAKLGDFPLLGQVIKPADFGAYEMSNDLEEFKSLLSMGITVGFIVLNPEITTVLVGSRIARILFGFYIAKGRIMYVKQWRDLFINWDNMSAPQRSLELIRLAIGAFSTGRRLVRKIRLKAAYDEHVTQMVQGPQSPEQMALSGDRVIDMVGVEIPDGETMYVREDTIGDNVDLSGGSSEGEIGSQMLLSGSSKPDALIAGEAQLALPALSERSKEEALGVMTVITGAVARERAKRRGDIGNHGSGPGRMGSHVPSPIGDPVTPRMEKDRVLGIGRLTIKDGESDDDKTGSGNNPNPGGNDSEDDKVIPFGRNGGIGSTGPGSDDTAEIIPLGKEGNKTPTSTHKIDSTTTDIIGFTTSNLPSDQNTIPNIGITAQILLEDLPVTASSNSEYELILELPLEDNVGTKIMNFLIDSIRNIHNGNVNSDYSGYYQDDGIIEITTQQIIWTLEIAEGTFIYISAQSRLSPTSITLAKNWQAFLENIFRDTISKHNTNNIRHREDKINEVLKTKPNEVPEKKLTAPLGKTTTTVYIKPFTSETGGDTGGTMEFYLILPNFTTETMISDFFSQMCNNLLKHSDLIRPNDTFYVDEEGIRVRGPFIGFTEDHSSRLIFTVQSSILSTYPNLPVQLMETLEAISNNNGFVRIRGNNTGSSDIERQPDHATDNPTDKVVYVDFRNRD